MAKNCTKEGPSLLGPNSSLTFDWSKCHWFDDNDFLCLASFKALDRLLGKLDLMAYLDPASNPWSKPQRFSVRNCKSSTPDKLQTFKSIFGISCKFLAKNSI